MEKLTDFQIENLIESMVQKNKKTKRTQLKEYYIKKWNNCTTKRERHQFFNEFFTRRKKLINEGQDVRMDEGILGDLFSGGLGGFKSTFKEWLSKKIVNGIASMFGASADPLLINAISIGLANLDWTKDWTKLVSPIKNCEYISDVLVDSVLEYYVDKKVDQMFGDSVLGDSLRNAVMDALSDETHVQSIQNALSGMFCKVIRNIFGGEGAGIMDKVGSMMKGGVKQPTGAMS